MNGQATLFVISSTKYGAGLRAVKHIDLRSERHRSNLRLAERLATEMEEAASRYCQAKADDRRAARDELLANHEFNRSHSRYRGK